MKGTTVLKRNERGNTGKGFCCFLETHRQRAWKRTMFTHTALPLTATSPKSTVLADSMDTLHAAFRLWRTFHNAYTGKMTYMSKAEITKDYGKRRG